MTTITEGNIVNRKFAACLSSILFLLLTLPLLSTYGQQSASQRKVLKEEKIPIEKLAGVKKGLVLPFQRGKAKRVTEGYYYYEEQDITRETYHGAVDIEAEEGTILYAPCSGVARASLQTLPPITDDKKQLILYKGQEIHSGAGICLQIQCEEVPFQVLLGHMASVWPELYVAPDKTPEGYFVPNPILKFQFTSSDGIRITAGTRVGTVGTSGLALGPLKETLGNLASAKAGTSWDEPHVHMWVGQRNERGRRALDLDAFGWYGTTLEFPYREWKQHPEYGLFKTDTAGRIKYAKE